MVDLFGHILIVPNPLVLGNLLANQTVELEISNLYPEDKEVTGVTASGDPGVVMSGLPTFPVTLPPYASLTVEVSISTSGPPQIQAVITAATSDTGGTDPLNVPVPGHHPDLVNRLFRRRSYHR